MKKRRDYSDCARRRNKDVQNKRLRLKEKDMKSSSE
jgi:hypothetical protein